MIDWILLLSNAAQEIISPTTAAYALAALGLEVEVLDRDACVAAEPGLATAQVKFVGGLRLPNDETGDCHLFTNRLAEMAAALGVKFRWNTRIQALQVGGGAITGVQAGRAFTDLADLVIDAALLAVMREMEQAHGRYPGGRVAVMGMERITFIWFFKKISLLALMGYVAGAAVYLLQVQWYNG